MALVQVKGNVFASVCLTKIHPSKISVFVSSMAWNWKVLCLTLSSAVSLYNLFIMIDVDTSVSQAFIIAFSLSSTIKFYSVM